MIFIISSLILLFFLLKIYFRGTSYSGTKSSHKGCCAVITGGNSGVGKETARELAKAGCHVIIGARDEKKAKQIIKQIKEERSQTKIEYFYLDLGDKESIREFVKQIELQKIDFLINNAGVMGIQTRKMTKSGNQMHFGINFLGHFYLTHLLWPKLSKSKFFRVINLTSITHKRILGYLNKTPLNFDDVNYQKIKYNPHEAYAKSKLYMVLFTHALAQRMPKNGLTISVHPGVVRTQIYRYILSNKALQISFKLIQPFYSIFTKSCKEGAQTTIFGIFAEQTSLKNGYYYADCKISNENSLSTKENWEKLWELSENLMQINFGRY